MKGLDINADVGEGTGNDEDVLGQVSSASIACGGHAGDENTMLSCLELCRRNGVRAGAHPGYEDKAGFGRRRLDIPIEQVQAQVGRQVLGLRTLAQRKGVALAYVKLHGALANRASEDFHFAKAVFAPVGELDPGLAVLAMEGTFQVDAARALGLPVILEAYADRGYRADGQLVPRGEAGAMLIRPEDVVERCRRLLDRNEIVATDGTLLQRVSRSLCLHGDAPGAVELASTLRRELTGRGYGVDAASAPAMRYSLPGFI